MMATGEGGSMSPEIPSSQFGDMTGAEREEAGHVAQSQWERDQESEAPKVDKLAWLKKFFKVGQKPQA